MSDFDYPEATHIEYVEAENTQPDNAQANHPYADHRLNAVYRRRTLEDHGLLVDPEFTETNLYNVTVLVDIPNYAPLDLICILNYAIEELRRRKLKARFRNPRTPPADKAGRLGLTIETDAGVPFRVFQELEFALNALLEKSLLQSEPPYLLEAVKEGKLTVNWVSGGR